MAKNIFSTHLFVMPFSDTRYGNLRKLALLKVISKNY